MFIETSAKAGFNIKVNPLLILKKLFSGNIVHSLLNHEANDCV